MTEVGSVEWSAVLPRISPVSSDEQGHHGANGTALGVEIPDAEIEVMVRPDCLDCFPYTNGREANGQANNRQGVIVEREFRGSFYLYRVALPSGRTVRCLLPHTAEFPIGAEVEVALRHGHDLRPFRDQRALLS